ncbi:MAG: TolC family outer membrane protein [Kiloniellales bacterium]|nr:TolC family outer membrane protein [Kiloniellales bacterium]
MTLEEAVNAAIIFHPQIQRDEALERVADQEIEEAYSRYLPTVDLDVALGREITSTPVTRQAGNGGTVGNFVLDANGVARQMIVDGGATPGSVAAARANRRGATGDLRETSELIAIDAVQLYLNVQRDREFVALAEDNVREHEDLVDQVEGLVAAGRGSEADTAQANSRLALAQSTLEELRGTLRESESRFIETVGQEPGDLEPVALPGDYVEPATLDETIALAMEGNPSVQASSARVAQTKHEIRVARANFYPRVDVEAFSGWRENQSGVDGTDADLNLRARGRWNVFNGFGDVARERQAEQLHNAAIGTFDDERRRIREETRVVWDSLETARAQVPPLTQHVEAQRRVREAYRGQFDVGRRTLLDLLDSQNELFQAELQLTDAEFNVDVSEYELIFVTGRLLKTLGIVVPSDEDDHLERGETD